jgi:polar amino acid transport system permease protein
MVADDLIAVAPPGARGAVPFRGNLTIAIIIAVAAVAAAAFTWAMLWKFDQSLHVDSTRRLIARIVESLVAIGVLAVPGYALLALRDSARANRYARIDRRHDAQEVLENSRERIWLVVGLGLSACVVSFVAYLLSAHDGRVRTVMFDWSLIWTSRTAVLRGFWLNIKIFVVAEALVLVWSLIVAIVRLLPGRACAPIRILAIAYSDVFRGIPAIITIYLIGFGFPLAGVPPFDHLRGDDQLFWLGVTALVVVYGAYVSEVYRAGIESIHWSQTAAARSLGLSQWQALRYVVVPQAIRRVLPPLLNDFVALQKDTALLSILGVVEALGAAQLLKSRYFNLSPVTGAALCFLLITIPFTRFVDYLIDRDRRRTSAQ